MSVYSRKQRALLCISLLFLAVPTRAFPQAAVLILAAGNHAECPTEGSGHSRPSPTKESSARLGAPTPSEPASSSEAPPRLGDFHQISAAHR